MRGALMAVALLSITPAAAGCRLSKSQCAVVDRELKDASAAAKRDGIKAITADEQRAARDAELDLRYGHLAQPVVAELQRIVHCDELDAAVPRKPFQESMLRSQDDEWIKPARAYPQCR